MLPETQKMNEQEESVSKRGRIPTEGELDMVEQMLKEVDGVLDVRVRCTVSVIVEMAPHAKRRAVYEQEGAVIDKMPDLRFDFCTRQNREPAASHPLSPGCSSFLIDATCPECVKQIADTIGLRISDAETE